MSAFEHDGKTHTSMFEPTALPQVIFESDELTVTAQGRIDIFQQAR